MLVLSRRTGESLLIGHSILIKVLGVDDVSGRVKLGVTAPDKNCVHRKEVHDRITAMRKIQREFHD